MAPLVRVLLCACAIAPVTGCGIHPVTQNKALQFVRQSQGSDYTLDAALTEYIRAIGAKLAGVSERQLLHEFVLLNESVPNAWAIPGGKITVNRGLLYELHNEAELAAVIGDEIVHAAALMARKAWSAGDCCKAPSWPHNSAPSNPHATPNPKRTSTVWAT